MRRLVARTLRALAPRPLIRVVDDLYRRIEQTDREVDLLKEAMQRTTRSLVWFAECSIEAASERPPVPEDTLVSVVMPVWNRADLIGQAIESVRAQTYGNWELIVVDDGSTDDTVASVRRFAFDQRIRLIEAPHEGVSAARNRAFETARGAYIAYLDSDNAWYPYFLQEVVRAFSQAPEAQCVYLAQLVRDTRTGAVFIRGEAFDRDSLLDENYVDLNVFAHRRTLLDRHGGFDATLTRGEDWDLILRYTADMPPKQVSLIGGVYELAAPRRILERIAVDANRYRIMEKLGRSTGAKLSVLVVVPDVAAVRRPLLAGLLSRMKRWGVSVAIWCAEGPPPENGGEVDGFPCYAGTLSQVLSAARPDILHVEGMALVEASRNDIAGTGIPLSCFEDVGGERPETRFLLPGAETEEPVEVALLPPAVDGTRYFPAAGKERWLVVQVVRGEEDFRATGLFFRLAKRIPDYRFVLLVASGALSDEKTATLRFRCEEKDDKSAVVECADEDEIAQWIGRAGVFLQGEAPVEPAEMGVSVVRALAAGCHVVAPRREPAIFCLDDIRATYETEDDAAWLIAQSMDWDTARWEAAERAAVERAFRRFADSVVYRPVLESWLGLAEKAGAGATGAGAGEAGGQASGPENPGDPSATPVESAA